MLNRIKRITSIFFLIAAVCLLFTTPIFSLDPDRDATQYIHETWSIDQGLPQTTVHDIVQTPDGYLWLATQEGLVRFDGADLNVYDDSGSGLAPSQLWIRTLCAGHNNDLWIGSYGGASLI
ncbi:MAG: hypothetical protein GY940_32105 [bacterium]|nr:hypothetical protein [bacterium]